MASIAQSAVLLLFTVASFATETSVEPTTEALIDAGVAAARACDEELHDVVEEYAHCIQGRAMSLATMPAAVQAGFWFVAWSRVQVADLNGYPDAREYESQYRAHLKQWQQCSPLPLASLCAAVLADCERVSSLLQDR